MKSDSLGKGNGTVKKSPASDSAGQPSAVSTKDLSDIGYDEFCQLVAQAPDTPDANEGCAVSRTLDVIQGKWKEHILFYLSRKGTCRFGEIHRAYPRLSKTMLSTTLKQLEADGLVTRRQLNEIPPHTEYSLTEAGRDLMPVFYELFRWGMTHIEGCAF